jgi:iduronate 2-sulfatase
MAIRLCLLLCLAFMQVDFANAEQPNVLFIAVDDMRCDLGCFGNSNVKSPNIDRLASTGVLFRHAYCQQAVCNPSRVSLLTGLRPDTTRVWDLTTEMRTVVPNVVTLPQHFRQHGYQAVAYGKIYHNPFPDAVSWDEPTHNAQDVVAHSAENRSKLAEFKVAMRASGKPENTIERMRGPATEIQEEPDDRNYDGKQTSDAIQKMNELAAEEKPFFLAVGYIRPHLPFITPKPYWDLYNREDIPLASNGFIPSNAPEVAFGDRSSGGFYELRGYMDYADAPSPFEGPLSVEQQRELKHGYYASVSFVDAQIGRLLHALEKANLAEKTIVVLWSDHGWKLGEHGGWCKQTNYEVDTRVPLIIRSPSAKGNGKVCDSLVELVDVFPTLVELANLPIPNQLQGKSLKPILENVDLSVKDAAFSQFPRKHEGKDFMGYAMRTNRYRYVEWLDAVSGEVFAKELYDHQSDSDENRNLANEEGQQTNLQTLNEKMWSLLPRPAFPLSITTQGMADKPTSSNAVLTWNSHDPNIAVPVSKPNGAFQSVTFTNQRKELVELVWLGPDGTEKVYQTIMPDGNFRIRTRPGIVWLVRSTKGESLGFFVVEPKPRGQAAAIIPK